MDRQMDWIGGQRERWRDGWWKEWINRLTNGRMNEWFAKMSNEYLFPYRRDGAPLRLSPLASLDVSFQKHGIEWEEMVGNFPSLFQEHLQAKLQREHIIALDFLAQKFPPGFSINPKDNS